VEDRQEGRWIYYKKTAGGLGRRGGSGNRGGRSSGAAGRRLAALRVGEEAVWVGNPNRPSYMQPAGPVAGSGDRTAGWASGWAGRPHRLLGQVARPACWIGYASRGLPGPAGQARPHGPDGPGGGTGLPVATRVVTMPATWARP
jgi:hypothetical protein